MVCETWRIARSSVYAVVPELRVEPGVNRRHEGGILAPVHDLGTAIDLAVFDREPLVAHHELVETGHLLAVDQRSTGGANHGKKSRKFNQDCMICVSCHDAMLDSTGLE